VYKYVSGYSEYHSFIVVFYCCVVDLMLASVDTVMPNIRLALIVQWNACDNDGCVVTVGHGFTAIIQNNLR